MIAGIFHQGSGLGNQLHRYITVRTLAEDKGYSWGMLNPENFKGKSFMQNLQLPEIGTMIPARWWNEKETRENGVDVRSYDPEVNFTGDNIVIDGEFQDERYWGHRLSDIRKWLWVEPLKVDDDLCVIGFRGGEYSLFPDLFLTREYWDRATSMFTPKINFEVHTDDPVMARQFFPSFPVVDNKQISHSLHTNMGLNWRAMRFAKDAIIANSSFYILPRLLKHFEDPAAVTIAPRYWGRRNTKVWALPQNYYKKFTYI